MTAARLPGRLRRSLLASLAAIAVALSAAPSATALGAAPLGVGPLAAPAPFELDLASRSDFVAQTNFVQCVGASMQMMLNITTSLDDRSAARQLELQRLARSLSPSRPDGREREGASVRGWADGLNRLGAGPYRLVGTTSIEEAMRLAAGSIRATRHPVGLLMWHGRHAWVMSGFRATADPLRSAGFRVTAAVVLDPLYPHGSRTWGPSPSPRQALSIAGLARQFVPRRSGSMANAWLAGFAGQYVLVLPYTPVPAPLRVAPVAA